jgi:hypothetical protein
MNITEFLFNLDFFFASALTSEAIDAKWANEVIFLTYYLLWHR